MAQFNSFGDGVEVLGEVIMAFVEGFPPVLKDSGLKLLENHGIQNPQRGKFYLLQALLDSMSEVSESFGANVLNQIGEKIATNAKLPPDMTTLEACLSSIDTAYRMNHRGGEIGYYRYSFKGSNGFLTRAEIVCTNPYPCSFDRGVIDGFAKRFNPNALVDVIVREDESASCRRSGGNTCLYHISWTAE